MPPSSRKSGEFNHAPNPKAPPSSSPSVPGSTANPSNKGNGSASASLLNGGSLMVGSGNGNVVSYGGGVKCGGKAHGEMPSNTNVASVDQALLKRAQASSDPEEIKNVANGYYKRGKFSEALVLYDVIVDRCPDNSAFRSNRAAALSGLGRLAEAVLECEQAIKLDSHNVRAHQRAASLYLRLVQDISPYCVPCRS
jgi:tetratricopeptide (TPR) repeat protein